MGRCVVRKWEAKQIVASRLIPGSSTAEMESLAWTALLTDLGAQRKAIGGDWTEPQMTRRPVGARGILLLASQSELPWRPLSRARAA